MANKEKQATKGETGTATVTVALKHPTGVIIEAFEQVEIYEPVLGGGQRKTFIYRSTGKQYALNGNRVPFGKIPNFKIVGGYALTNNIPKDVWEIWLKQHPDSPLVENRLIMAYEEGDKIEAFAEEHQTTRSGMEPLLRTGDTRVGKVKTRDGKFVDSIQTADEQPTS